MLLTQPGTKLRLDEPWVDAVAEHLARGAATALPRPISSFFVCEKEKLLYSPIAKCACTSLKRLMVELSQLPHTDLVLQHGVHRVTDAFVTGSQLKDLPMETVREVLAGTDYYKFAIVREPVRRIISAYTDKFLLNRLDQSNQIHTRDPVRTIRCESNVDLQQGVTFREFVNYLLASDPARLDPHWAPQHLFLAGVDCYNDIFTMEQLDQLAARLSERTGRDITLGKHNTTLDHKDESLDSNPGRYAGTLPAELEEVADISAHDFMAVDLVEQLQAYYQEDVALYDAALKGLRDFRPVSVDLDTDPNNIDERPLTSAPEIARCVSLYTKGYFALNNEGVGQVPLLISNTRQYPLDFRALPSCSLVYFVRDSEGVPIHDPLEQSVQLGLLPAGNTTLQTLTVEIPEPFRQQPITVVISLRFGEAFHVEDVAPLHIASAQLALKN